MLLVRRSRLLLTWIILLLGRGLRLGVYRLPCGVRGGLLGITLRLAVALGRITLRLGWAIRRARRRRQGACDEDAESEECAVGEPC